MTAELPTVAEAARGFRDGALSPVDVTALCLERIERFDPALRTYHRVFADEAMAAARAAERALGGGEDLGPLHGIPIALKDVLLLERQEDDLQFPRDARFRGGRGRGVRSRG